MTPDLTGRRRFRGVVAAVAIATFLPVATTGCFGRFELIRKVYRFNKEVDQDKWVQWFVFLVLNIVPVYSLASLIDALFANSVEFWTDKNPVTAKAGTTRVVHGPNGELAELKLRSDGALDLSLRSAEGQTYWLKLVREGNGVAAFDADGSLVARVRDVAGHPMLVSSAAH